MTPCHRIHRFFTRRQVCGLDHFLAGCSHTAYACFGHWRAMFHTADMFTRAGRKFLDVVGAEGADGRHASARYGAPYIHYARGRCRLDARR